MIIINKAAPKPRFWHEDFLKDFETNHHNQTASMVIWSENPSSIISQIKFAIENKTELVLTDMLPDELPERVLNHEYKFFVEKFIYIFPHFKNNFKIQDNTKCDNFQLLVTDREEKSSNFNKSLELVKGELIKKSFLIQKSVDELYKGKSESFLLNNNFKKIIVDTIEPTAQLYLTLIAACKNIEIKFLSKPVLSISRIFGCGLDFFPKHHSDSEHSLRQTIKSLFFEPKNEITIIYKSLLEKICSSYSYDNFLRVTENDVFLRFCNQSPRETIDDRLWINPWYNFSEDKSGTKKVSLGRFKRRQINTFINLSINDKKVLEKFSKSVDKLIEGYLQSFLFCLKSGAWMEDFRLIVLTFPQLFDECIPKIINNRYLSHNKAQDIFSSIAELIFFASFEHGIKETERTNLRSISLHFFKLDKDSDKLAQNSKYRFHYELIECFINKPSELYDKVLECLNKPITFKNSIEHSTILLPLIFEKSELIKVVNNLEINETSRMCLVRGILRTKNVDLYRLFWIKEESETHIYNEISDLFETLEISCVYSDISNLKAGKHFNLDSSKIYSPKDKLNLFIAMLAYGKSDEALSLIKSTEDQSIYNQLESCFLLPFQKDAGSIVELNSYINQVDLHKLCLPESSLDHPLQLSFYSYLADHLVSSCKDELARKDQSESTLSVHLRKLINLHYSCKI